MKKVLGTLAVAIVLVAAFPMTASAGNAHVRTCGMFLRPCPNTLPPVSGTGNGNGTRSGGAGTGTSNSGGSSKGSRTLPPTSLPPVGR